MIEKKDFLGLGAAFTKPNVRLTGKFLEKVSAVLCRWITATPPLGVVRGQNGVTLYVDIEQPLYYVAQDENPTTNENGFLSGKLYYIRHGVSLGDTPVANIWIAPRIEMD